MMNNTLYQDISRLPVSTEEHGSHAKTPRSPDGNTGLPVLCANLPRITIRATGYEMG